MPLLAALTNFHERLPDGSMRQDDEHWSVTGNYVQILYKDDETGRALAETPIGTMVIVRDPNNPPHYTHVYSDKPLMA